MHTRDLRKAGLSAILIILLLGAASASLAVAVRAQEPIRIAAIFSLSGPAAIGNAPSLEGVRWAIDEINAAGGVLDRPLELIEIDNFSTPIGAKVAADMAVAHQVVAIIGSSWSSHSIATARVAQVNRIPMISNISTHPSLTAIGDYIFRVCYNDLLQGRVMAQFARDHLKARSVVICFDLASDYSMGLSDSFQTVFESMGGRVLERIPYKARQSNYRKTVDAIRQFDPDVLFVPGYSESGAIVAESKRQGLRAVPLGGDGWDAEDFFTMGGDQLVSGFFSTHWSPAIQTARSLAFVARYGSRSGSLMAPMALGYDATQLLADALRRAGSTRSDRLRDALAATRDLEGVTGRITLNPAGDPIKSLVIMEIRDGRPIYFSQVHPLP